MSSYEELKRRVAMLKQVDREETMARKAVAAQENAEVARAKATMFAKEKENDERLHAAKKALHAATERSQAMRKQYESEVKRLQQKLDVTTGKLAASEEKASRESVAAETRRRDALAEVNARWEADVAERDARRREETEHLERQLEEARAKSSDRTSELLVRTAQAEEAASAAREYSAALKDELEKLKASTSESTETWARERDALIAKHETKVLAVDAHHEKRVEALKEEHRATLAAVDGRVRNTIGRMRDDNIRLKSQLAASQEREGALSRVLSDQAARLLSEA